MTFGSIALVLSAAVSGSPKCADGQGLCDCISSFEGVVLEDSTYKLLDLPADCAEQWVAKSASKSIAEVEAANTGKKLVTGGAPGDGNEVCRTKFNADSSVKYHDPTGNGGAGDPDGQPEYHHAGEDAHTYKWHVGRVYGSDDKCHWGTWSVKDEAGGEEFYAPTYELLMVPTSCTYSWKDPATATEWGRIPTQDEKTSGAIAFCERSAICAVADSGGVWHPGYAVGAHGKHACSKFCKAGDCEGVCAGCAHGGVPCQVAGAPMGEGYAEGAGGCSTGSGSSSGEALSAEQVEESSVLAVSVSLLAGLLAA